jgi:hypothetical protein
VRFSRTIKTWHFMGLRHGPNATAHDGRFVGTTMAVRGGTSSAAVNKTVTVDERLSSVNGDGLDDCPINALAHVR